MKKFNEFINEMNVVKYPKYKKITIKDIHKNAEPHTHYNLSSTYYEKIGSFGLSIIGGTEKLDYGSMGDDMKKLYSFLPAGAANPDKSPLMGDFIDDFEVAIFNWEGDEVTYKFTDIKSYRDIKEINKIRKAIFDVVEKGPNRAKIDNILGGPR